jgi:hypothetical protein
LLDHLVDVAIGRGEETRRTRRRKVRAIVPMDYYRSSRVIDVMLAMNVIGGEEEEEGDSVG